MKPVSKCSICLLFLVLSQLEARVQNDFVAAYLESIYRSSLEVKIIGDESQSQALSSQLDLSTFDLTSSLGASITRDQTPSANPFGVDQVDSNAFSLGLEKTWKEGFETKLDYSYSENTIGFPSGSTIYYQFPELTLTVSTSLFQDLLSARYKDLLRRIESDVESISLDEKRKKKVVLANSLLAIAEILEIKDELSLQKELCNQTNRQTSQLEKKYARRSISKKDYLLSRKDLNACSATILNLEKSFSTKVDEFKVSFNLNYNKVPTIDVSYFVQFFKEEFSKIKASGHEITLEKDLDIKVLKKSLQTSLYKQKELDALRKPDLDLELKLGASGLDRDYRESHQELGEVENPYVYFGVKFELPVEDRKASLQSTSNLLQIKAQEKKLAQKKLELSSKASILEKTLASDFEVFKKYEENVSLSRQILKEGRKDFNNGRIDFFNLIELQKGLLQSQKQLSSLRTQIVIKSVEFLDLYQFFDRFLKGQ